MNGRKAKIKSWLNHFTNELYTYQQCFFYNLISRDDIGQYNFNNIVDKINDLNIAIDKTLFELENK